MREIKLRYFDGIEIKPLHLDDWTFYNGELCHRNKKLYPVMQYTGLKDENGVEIYEGDICTTPESTHKGIITWQDGNCSFYFHAILGDDEGNQDCELHYTYDFEIIGNIYENPELILAK